MLEAERILGQRFVIDATLHVDVGPAAQSDDVADTVDYAAIHSSIRRAVEDDPPLNLLEALARRVGDAALEADPRGRIEAVDVTVKKPHVALGAARLGWVGVTTRRVRPQ